MRGISVKCAAICRYRPFVPLPTRSAGDKMPYPFRWAGISVAGVAACWDIINVHILHWWQVANTSWGNCLCPLNARPAWCLLPTFGPHQWCQWALWGLRLPWRACPVLLLYLSRTCPVSVWYELVIAIILQVNDYNKRVNWRCYLTNVRRWVL